MTRMAISVAGVAEKFICLDTLVQGHEQPLADPLIRRVTENVREDTTSPDDLRTIEAITVGQDVVSEHAVGLGIECELQHDQSPVQAVHKFENFCRFSARHEVKVRPDDDKFPVAVDLLEGRKCVASDVYRVLVMREPINSRSIECIGQGFKANVLRFNEFVQYGSPRWTPWVKHSQSHVEKVGDVREPVNARNYGRR